MHFGSPKAGLEVMALGSLGMDFEAKAVSKARFGIDQRLGVSVWSSIYPPQLHLWSLSNSPDQTRNSVTITQTL